RARARPRPRPRGRRARGRTEVEAAARGAWAGPRSLCEEVLDARPQAARAILRYQIDEPELGSFIRVERERLVEQRVELSLILAGDADRLGPRDVRPDLLPVRERERAVEVRFRARDAAARRLRAAALVGHVEFVDRALAPGL